MVSPQDEAELLAVVRRDPAVVANLEGVELGVAVGADGAVLGGELVSEDYLKGCALPGHRQPPAGGVSKSSGIGPSDLLVLHTCMADRLRSP